MIALSYNDSSLLNGHSTYRNRILLSFGFSLLLNIVFLWLFLVSQVSQWMQSKESRKQWTKEVPHLVLVERPLEPAKSRSKTFLETDANQAVIEKPKETVFYSEHNTIATQTAPSPVKPGDIPKADGHHTKSLATENVLVAPKPSSSPPPSPPQPISKATESSSTHPISSPQTVIDLSKTKELALLKTSPPPKEKSLSETRPPKTVENPSQPSSPSMTIPQPSSNREVLAAMSKLEGGVPRVGKALAFNSAESPFASYDKKIIGKIGAYWQYQIVDKFFGEQVGEVEISFKLLSNGRISELQIHRNSANEILANWCIQAVEKSAPFSPFPDTMKALVGDSREGTITFAY